MAREGASVMVAEINEKTGTCVVAELKALGVKAEYVQTDIRHKASILASVEATRTCLGGVDILVNNAWPSGGSPQRLESMTDETFEGAFTAGLESVWWAMRAVFPAMRANQWGRIINLCSLNGVNAHPYTAHFNTMKEGVRALSRTAAREWAEYGICVNVICPAAATPAYEHFKQIAPETVADMLKQNPMGRMGDPENDIGPVAVFLASEDCRYLTGTTQYVDGGSHINGVSWLPQVADSD
jgi:NAD(P)-dependent dehydrogenase (short-subunit alcohol dehydrogenase family)